MCKHRGNRNTHTCYGLYGTTIVYCVYCIHEKYSNKEVTRVPRDKLMSLETITWDGELFSELREYHLKKIREADIRYPIVIAENYEVVDGCHRLYKLHEMGVNEVQTIVLSLDELNECVF